MDPIAPLIDSLHAQGRLRVWSLLITIFGDSVQLRGGQISTARLQILLQRIGIESGTLRTALSRLSRDGWVSSKRVGKSSLYQLDPKGLADFDKASHRIYAPPRHGKIAQWSIGTAQSRDAIAIGSLWLTPIESAGDAGDFELIGDITHLSADLRKTLVDPAHQASLVQLFDDLDTLHDATLDPLSAAAASTLLIHRWRRLILRFPDIPPELMPDAIGLRNPRAEVAKAYHTLTNAAEDWWAHSNDDTLAMPAARPEITQRFNAADRS